MLRAAKSKIIIGLIIVAVCLALWFFAAVFSGRIILPQFFRLGPLTIHYYGLTMAAAVAGGFYLALRRAPGYGLSAQQAEDVLFWTIIFGFIGARLYHVMSSIGFYVRHPLNIFMVWNGGLSIYGAVLAGALTLWLLLKIFNLKFSILNLLDWLAPSVILGQVIGRLGNFFNYEAFGYPTNLPWKMFVPAQFRPQQFLSSAYFHPFFLYEMLGNAVIFALLIWLSNKKKLPKGALFFFYLLLYNCWRFALEFLRIDSTFIFGGWRLNVLSSLLLAALAGAGLLYLRKHNAQVS